MKNKTTSVSKQNLFGFLVDSEIFFPNHKSIYKEEP